MRAVTNRKCGTCRFYEAGTQQLHGWCRNPAYPRRDEVALLRPEELGCRSGWGKDYWAARDGAAAALEAASPRRADQVIPMPGEDDVTAPIVHVSPAASAVETASEGGAVPSMSPARRRGFQGPAVAPVSVTPQPVMAAKEPVSGFDSSLTGHPELGENGVPIRSTRRSAVAEAHRRALERREQERAAVAERSTVMAPERRPAPTPPAAQPQVSVNPRPVPVQPTITFGLDLPQRETPRPATTPPEPPAPSP